MKKLKILLADDHYLMRMGLKSLIATEPDMTVVGEAGDGETAVRLADELRPDVIVMDLMMPVMTGGKATAEIHGRIPDAHILILTTYGTSQELLDALDNGASGVLLKDTATDDLTDAIRRTAAGERIIPESISQLIEESQGIRQLTARQQEMLQALTRGLTDKEIADSFSISVSGTKHQMRRIFAKIGAANRAEAVAIALKKHLLNI